jgi:RHS repeat-associated protein
VNGSGSGLGYTYTTTLQTLSRSLSNAGGQLIMSDRYTDFTGTTYAYTTPPFVVSGAVQGTNFERTEYGYDKRGRQARVLDAEGTIRRTYFDQQDRVVSTWIGTDDTPTTGLWSPTNTSGTDLVQLSSMVYDNGGVGDGNLTASTQIPGGGLADRTTAYFYDWRNRTVAVKSGVETTTESTSVNRAVSYTEYDNLNQTLASYVYDGDGVTITSTAGVPNQPNSSLLRAKSSADYNDQGRVFKSTQYEVDQTTGTIGSGTLVTQSFHDIRGLTAKSRDARGNDTIYAYDGVGRQTTMTTADPDGAGSGVAIVSQTNYDANGNVTSSVLNPASDNFITAYTYDALDRRLTVTQPDPDGAGILTSPVTTYAYNTAGWLETVTDPLSRVTKTEYDRLGRTIKTTLPDPTTGSITGSSPIYQTTYNGVGNVLMTTDALGNFTSYGYNYLHQRTSTTQADPDGGGSLTAPVSSATYSIGGDLLTTTDPEGRVTTYEYDLLGRQFQVTMPDPDGSGGVDAARMTYTFDTLGGVLTTTDRLSYVTSSAYDGFHRLATSTNANSEATTFTYDANGNRLSLTDPNGNETSWVYDALNRVTSETNELNKTRSFTYDTAGRLQTRTDHLNRVIEYVYDNLSRVTAEKWGTTSVTPTTQYTWIYDAAGQMLTGGNSATREYVNTYDKLGRVTQIDTNEFGLNSVYDLNMTYDVNGNRLTRSHTANTATWSYDFLNRAKDITATGAVGTYGAAFGYNAASQMSFQENKDSSVNSGIPFSRTDYAYDGAGRLQDITHKDASNNPFASYGYTWDASDRITAVDFLDGIYDNEDVDYAYDAAGQVTGADRTGIGTDEAYDYDTNGNRESVTRDGATTTWGVGTNNQLTSDGTNSYTYDDEGNLTSDGVSTYYWDHRNRLIEVRTSSTGVMFTYDHHNLRVGKILDLDGDWDYSDTAELDTQTSYYFDGGRMVREVSADGTIENNYLFGMNGQMIAVEDVANGAVEFAYNDHLGSVRDVIAVDVGAAIHTEHNSYDSFGRVIERQEFDGTTWNVVTSESIVSLGYTGEYFEVTIGLQYNWNRWYNADNGRWISEDPIGFRGGDTNISRYCGNSTVIFLDPSGLDFAPGGDDVGRVRRTRQIDFTLQQAKPFDSGWFPMPLFGMPLQARYKTEYYVKVTGSVEESDCCVINNKGSVIRGKVTAALTAKADFDIGFRGTFLSVFEGSVTGFTSTSFSAQGSGGININDCNKKYEFSANAEGVGQWDIGVRGSAKMQWSDAISLSGKVQGNARGIVSVGADIKCSGPTCIIDSGLKFKGGFNFTVEASAKFWWFSVATSRSWTAMWESERFPISITVPNPLPNIKLK